MSDDLAANVVRFCAHLRTELGFLVGPRETQQALRAIEAVGIDDRARVAAALRAVCCSRFEEIEPFEHAFAVFFNSKPLGIAQPKQIQRRRTRAERNEPPAAKLAQRRSETEALSLAEAWEMRRARYSPMPAGGEAITIPTEGLGAVFAQVDRLLARLHLVASFRWKPQPRGVRFDLRRTLRASLRTGGEVIAPRMLGHRLRSPRFLLLVDGSRSMSEHGTRVLQLAHAFCRRSRRSFASLFSTNLRDVTRRLREIDRSRSYRLDDLGDAWGGGTRIGASLTEALRAYRAHLDDRTFAIVISDGLDTGDIPQLKRAMRDLDRRTAGVAWINPDAATPGYVPSAKAMRAALPYVKVLTSLDDIEKLSRLTARA